VELDELSAAWFGAASALASVWVSQMDEAWATAWAMKLLWAEATAGEFELEHPSDVEWELVYELEGTSETAARLRDAGPEVAPKNNREVRLQAGHIDVGWTGTNLR
jgi:hypothetical protein